MAIDLKRLNHDQLSNLIARAQARQAELSEERAAKLRERIRSMVEAEGLDLADVVGTGRGRKAPKSKARARGKVPPKYRNPADPAQVWSGRGLKPRWFVAALKAGKKEKDLLIR